MKQESLIRNGIYSIEEVLSKRVPSSTANKESKVDFDGDLIKMNSLRYEVFDVKGLSCCKCGIIGQYFAKEKFPNTNGYHFNLYAVNENGEEILMTKDHIVPKSKGGKDHISNFDTMCGPCNWEKGNIVEEENIAP